MILKEWIVLLYFAFSDHIVHNLRQVRFDTLNSLEMW